MENRIVFMTDHHETVHASLDLSLFYKLLVPSFENINSSRLRETSQKHGEVSTQFRTMSFAPTSRVLPAFLLFCTDVNFIPIVCSICPPPFHFIPYIFPTKFFFFLIKKKPEASTHYIFLGQFIQDSWSSMP